MAKKRIQILTSGEIKELYDRPIFNHIEREECFALDDNILNVLNSMAKRETKIYLILLIGYFRYKPVIPKFHLSEVKEDVEYLMKTYFPGKKVKFPTLVKSTRSKLVNKMLFLLGFDNFSNRLHKKLLISRLQDVATISTDPRYIFDECLAFFGQKLIALTAYTTLQDFVTEALRAERQRTELILSQQMSDLTLTRLNKILNTKATLNGLSGYKGSARDFSPSEIDRELHTHQTIKEIYPELKLLIAQLGLSQGNLDYYASIIKHHSIYKIRRYPKWQKLLYLTSYLYFRYRETNDKLVIAFSYLVRKHQESAKASAKQRIADELEVIRDKLKYAGNILHYFVDETLDDNLQFGEIRQKAFTLISKDEVKMISQHLDKNNFDLSDYEWQYTDKHSRKIANSLRKLFIAIDVECDQEQPIMMKQIVSSKEELLKKGSCEINFN